MMSDERLVNRVIALAERDGVIVTNRQYNGWFARFVSLDGGVGHHAGPYLKEKTAMVECAINYLESK